MTREEAIESFKCSNEQAKLRLEVEKMRMDSGEIKELEFYIERDEIAIKALEQEPKIGHWIWQTEDIYRCSECGNDIRVKEVMNIPQYVRCPMCEAKMVETQERSE